MIGGVVTEEEAHIVSEKIIKSFNELEPGFDIVNDLTKYIHGDEIAGHLVKNVGKFLSDRKVNRIVRIVGQSKTALMQFAKNTVQNENVTIKYFPTLEEAENFLNKS